MGLYDKLRQRLDAAGIRPSTRRGQNFLLDVNQLHFIAGLANLSPADVVLEVGPGSGFLTRQIALSGCLVLGVELDWGLLPVAEEETAGLPNVLYLRADILAGKNRINPDVLAKVEELLALKRRDAAGAPSASPAAVSLKCVSNLPYSAGTPLVMNLLSSSLPWEVGVFLLQREVAERLAAPPGGKDYGALSISAALASTTGVERIVSPRAFWPKPNVESAVVKMAFKPLEERMALPWSELRTVASAIFGSRRKTLKNALKGIFTADGYADRLTAEGFDPDCRGETLSPEEFLKLAELLKQASGT